MKKTIQELKGQKIEKLEKEVVSLRKEIAKLRLEAKVNPVKDTNIIVKKRKRLAMVLSLITEKKGIKELEKSEDK